MRTLIIVAVIAVVLIVVGLFVVQLIRRPATKHIPEDIKTWTPKHYVDETAEFTAIDPGRHATDTAWMPAIRPDVPRA